MRQRPVFALALFLVTFAARAEAGEDLAAAESLFQEGLRFKAQKDHAEACKRFARSEELAPAVGTLLNLGECHEQLHELAQSWLAYRQAIAVADANGDTKRAERARAEAARLEPRVPHLRIVAPSPPAGLVVTRDGAKIEAAALDAAVAIDPGRHVVAANAPGKKPWSKPIDIAEGASMTVTVPELEAAAHEAPGRSPRRAIGIGMEIGGGAILAGGLVAAAIAFAQWRSVEEACPNAGCPRAVVAERQNDVDAARTWATIGTVGIIAGATVLAAGITLHITAPKDAVAVAPLVGRDVAGVGLVWRR